MVWSGLLPIAGMEAEWEVHKIHMCIALHRSTRSGCLTTVEVVELGSRGGAFPRYKTRKRTRTRKRKFVLPTWWMAVALWLCGFLAFPPSSC